jgi:hypothetical protein
LNTIAQQLNVKDFPFEIKDKQGNLLYLEYSNGCWYKYEYDSFGRELYSENSDGFWRKSEYDSEGNRIYYNSDGRWAKSKYDSEGNRIYFENSRGVIIDDRPKEE